MKSHVVTVEVASPCQGADDVGSWTKLLGAYIYICCVFLHMKPVYQLHWRGTPRVSTFMWDIMALPGTTRLAWGWEEEGCVCGGNSPPGSYLQGQHHNLLNICSADNISSCEKGVNFLRKLNFFRSFLWLEVAIQNKAGFILKIRYNSKALKL